MPFRTVELPAEADLRAGAILQRRNRLEGLADKVVPKVSLNDVVLPDDTRRQVDAIVSAARSRETVFTKWGFGEKMSTGKSVSCLFIGESGTGKSMTAEAICDELGQALYPVNLAAVVSKYVGETEKNIAAVFASARESQAVLFFDEADSLFGSRLDEDSHHAHYINQQVSLLLTEMDRYDGIVILATNRADAFDPAFERRIRYRVEFPRPDAAAREAIWRELIPKGAPLADDVDFAALARQYDFCGGTIKNVVMRTAFEAATDGKVITGEILRRCAEGEVPLNGAGRIGFVA